MGLAADLRRFKTKAIGNLDAVVAGTVREFGESLVTDWTPFGDPALWKAPPPADYRPGNLQSSWFYSPDHASAARTEATDVRAVNDLDDLPLHPAGRRHYFSNSADHATAIEAGHSSQAPVGIMTVGQSEFAPLAYAVARRVAGK
jgi:hypothetical protein